MGEKVMKAKVSKKGVVTISGITAVQLSAISKIVNRANDTCFEFGDQQPSGDWYSNDDFVIVLTDEERQALRDICKVI